MVNDRRDKSGLVHQFKKLQQQVSFSLTPKRDRPGGSCEASRLRILLGAFLELKIPLFCKQLECDRYPILDSNATRP
ncbi:hypothetical protein SD81_003470 [Tolypothrix campylonemoides VB511288]|nr:hypothetical protein SD81_003470 [Tolypothrix campylonemoides VB511288]